MRISNLLFILLLPFTANAQGGLSLHEDSTLDSPDVYRKRYIEQYIGFNLPENTSLALFDTIANWIGTPYKYAGNGEKGIDCSGFVHMLISRVYGFNPGARSSAELYDLADKIDVSEMRAGDLVFFRIHRKRISHVGVYIGNNKFVHSSTSRGVIISDLDEPYYKRTFARPGRFKQFASDQSNN